MRLFVAGLLPPDFLEALTAWQVSLRASGLQAAWTRPENVHLTLAFLGDQPLEKAATLEDQALTRFRAEPPLSLRAHRWLILPSARAARVLALGLEADPRLLRLVEDLRRDLLRLGIAFDPKPFRPHITVARLRQPRVLALPVLEPLEAAVDRVALVESRLLPAGAEYHFRAIQRMGEKLA